MAARKRSLLRSPTFSVTILILLILLLAVNVWGLRPFGQGLIDAQTFGDLGTWVQGIGTLAAVLVALRAWQGDVRRQRTEVYTYLRYLDQEQDLADGWYLHFTNLTEMPISVWALGVAGDGPDGETAQLIDPQLFGPIMPGVTRHLIRSETRGFDKLEYTLWFADRAGDFWIRTASGELESTTPFALEAGRIVTRRRTSG